MATKFLAAVLGVALTAAVAQAEGEGPRGERPPRDPERRQKMLERFDTDGDGKLNEEERAAAREARQARRAEKGERGKKGDRAGRRGRGGMMRDPAALFDKIDTDGDGVISRDQFTAFVQQMREQMQAERGERGPRGARRRAGAQGDAIPPIE